MTKVYVKLTATTISPEGVPFHAVHHFPDQVPDYPILRTLLNQYEAWDIAYVVTDLPTRIDPGRYYPNIEQRVLC